MIGRSMFDFISGESFRNTYQGFVAAMRSGAARPSAGRLWIVITPVQQGGVVDGFLIQSLTVSEPRRQRERAHQPRHLPRLR